MRSRSLEYKKIWKRISAHTSPLELLGYVFLIALVISLGGFFLHSNRADAASSNIVGLQMRDNDCTSGTGSANYASDVGVWSPWTGDSDSYDPDCARFYVGNSIPADLDIRIGIQARDINTPCGFLWLFKCGDGGGAVVYGPWASTSPNSWSSWAGDADMWDADQWRLIVDTRPRYGYTVSDFKIGAQVGDISAWAGGCTDQSSPVEYTASSTAGPSWTNWVVDTYDAENFNCVRMNLIATSTLNSPVATFTGTSSAPAGNSINISWDVEYIDTTAGCTLVGRNGGGTVIDPSRSIYTNGAGATTSIAISVATTYTLTCPGFKTGTSATAVRTISPIAQPATLVFTMSPNSGLNPGSATVANIAVTNAASCTLVGKDTNYNVVDAGYTFYPPPPTAIETSATAVNEIIYLTSTAGGTWTVPFDWNSSNNSIEVIGGGGAGGNQNNGSGNTGGGGGGGGGYSIITNVNLTPGSAISYDVGAGGTSQGAGGDTWFINNTTLLAKGGGGGVSGGNGGTGGQANSGFGTIRYSGGNGGNHGNYSGGGGGGAAGPAGNGKNGGNGGNQGGGGGGGANNGSAGANSGSTAGGAGGTGPTGTAGGTPGNNGSNGSGGGGAPCCTNNSSGNGGAGTEWDASHGAGAGSGGGADNNTSAVGNAGLYGGGAGGDGDDSPCCSMDGAQGIIVIKYTHNASVGPIYISNTAQTTWTVPDDWSTPNTIEVIGGGGGGASGNSGRGGAGGGAYSKISNTGALVQGDVVTIKVGSGGISNTAGGDSYVCSSSSNCSSISGSAVIVGAKGGSAGGASTGAGGQASAGIGSTKYSGGTGGDSTGAGGAGGGGGAGPYGNGANGGNTNRDEGSGGGANSGGGNGRSANADGGCGLGCGGTGGQISGYSFSSCKGTGSNSGGSGCMGDGSRGGLGANGGGGGGGDDDTSTWRGGYGGNGIEWDATHGSGGGGGGGGQDGSAGTVGGNGGIYGGGGGGGTGTSAGGTGGSGLMVIYYSTGNTIAENTESHTSDHTVNVTTNYVVSCVPLDGTATLYSTTTITLSGGNCSLDGTVIPNGSPGVNFYKQLTPDAGHTCEEVGYVGVRGCTNGTLTGDTLYQYSTCSLLNGVIITANGVATSTAVRKGASSVAIEWDGGNADSCTISSSDGSLTSTEVVGSASTTVSRKTIYTATCLKNGITSSANVTVNILPTVIEI